MMTNKPIKEAIQIHQILDAISKRSFPINVENLALEYSKSKYSNDYIEKIKGADFDSFDGAFFRKHKDYRNIILYNNNIDNGRKNFTLAHEFGHYLMHRNDDFNCTRKNINNFTADLREQEANIFASNLLMPNDDFRQQVSSQQLSMGLIRELSNRYGVSKLAACIKMKDFKDVLIVRVENDYVDWVVPSDSLFKQGVYHNKQEIIEFEEFLNKYENTIDNLIKISEFEEEKIYVMPCNLSKKGYIYEENELSDMYDAIMTSTRNSK